MIKDDVNTSFFQSLPGIEKVKADWKSQGRILNYYGVNSEDNKTRIYICDFASEADRLEFRTLIANISGLTTGLSDEEQIDSLDKMIANYERIQKLASGENIIDVINFPPADADPKLLTREQQQYLKAGYVKEGDTLYYYPQGPDGPERVYNRETNEFK